MRVVNTGDDPGSVAQTLAAPGIFSTVSVWARTVARSDVTLVASTTGGNAAGSFVLSPQWKRISIEVGLGQMTDTVAFRGSIGRGRVDEGFVRDAGGGAAGRFGLQDDGRGRRSVLEGSICIRSIDGARAGDGCI